MRAFSAAKPLPARGLKGLRERKDVPQQVDAQLGGVSPQEA